MATITLFKYAIAIVCINAGFWFVVAMIFDDLEDALVRGFLWLFLGTVPLILWIIRYGVTHGPQPVALVFGGRISQVDHKRWLNDRLVILYAQDVEIGR